MGKPLADLALAATLAARLRARDDASRPGARDSRHDAGGDARVRHDAVYDAVLAHHVEAAIAAGAALRARSGIQRPRPPLIYCAHTLLGRELGSYLPDFARDSETDAPARSSWPERGADALGERLDRLAVRCGDGWIALTPTQARVMTQASERLGRVIAPPVPDPRQRPDPLDPTNEALRHGLEPGRYVVYSGNLDGYQDLALLGAAAAALARRARAEGRAATPLVVASHEPAARLRAGAPPGVAAVSVADAAAMRSLVAGARATLVPRRDPSGFPIKLGNALALGVPPIAFQAGEWGLIDGVNARIADAERPPAEAFAEAIGSLAGDPALAARLGEGARATWAARHRPAAVAAATLELVAEVAARRAARGAD